MANLYKYSMAVHVHKILSSSSPPYLHDKFIFSHNIHETNLRYVNRLSVPRHKTTLFQHSFLYNAVKIYNELDDGRVY
nr:unnamed protein product [Callosobruchus analis]